MVEQKALNEEKQTYINFLLDVNHELKEQNAQLLGALKVVKEAVNFELRMGVFLTIGLFKTEELLQIIERAIALAEGKE